MLWVGLIIRSRHAIVCHVAKKNDTNQNYVHFSLLHLRNYPADFYQILYIMCSTYNIYILCIDPSPSCELYHNGPTAICFKYGSIGMDYVFLNNSVDTRDSLNSKLIMFNDTLHKKEDFPAECIDLILGLMCHHSFPLCDYNSSTPVPRKVRIYVT